VLKLTEQGLCHPFRQAQGSKQTQAKILLEV